MNIDTLHFAHILTHSVGLLANMFAGALTRSRLA